MKLRVNLYDTLRKRSNCTLYSSDMSYLTLWHLVIESNVGRITRQSLPKKDNIEDKNNSS